MPDQSRTFVIVGGGMAGGKAAESLRAEGFDGRVVIVGAEPVVPYERPPLSKDYLAGSSPREKAFLQPADWWAEHEIELLTGRRATAIDVAGRRVSVDDGSELLFERLLIATGAVPKRPPIPGAGLDGVMTLRSMADSDELRERLQRPGARLAIVGGGWIGCEVAASARALGAEVTLLEAASQPMEGVLGAQLGAFFADLHRDHGVDVRTGVAVEELGGAGRVDHVRLAGGERIAADTVLLAVGVAPDTELAEAAGLKVDNGIVVDERLAASAPDVLAAGDVANAFHPRYGRHLRVEHWSNALNQGLAAGRLMLDAGEPYTRVPYFFSDQYDLGLEYVGLHSRDDRLVVRGDPATRHLIAFWLDADQRPTAAMHVNEWDAIDPLRRLVDAAAPADPERLADASVPLEELAPA